MPLVVLPNIAGSAKPSAADVNNADSAIASVVGGVANGVRHPGALDLANFAAGGRALQNAQKLEPRSRAVFTLSIRSACCPYDLSADVVQLWHSCAAALHGSVELYVGGQVVAVLQVPDPGGLQQVGEELQPYTVLEWRPPRFLIPARTPVNVKHSLLRTGEVPFDPAGWDEMLFFQVWGVTLHSK